MYRYDEFDKQLVNERVEQFRDQVKRRLSGELNEDQFKPLRLMNGLYLQIHAYMLRINVPYGCLSSQQLRGLARVARVYDKGFGHFTTRQNIQFNWIKLEEVPDLLATLAEVEMHCIQSSGNCIRNITSDQYAGCAEDEISDPRVYCELIRQWYTLHPEFSYLPRKFKIAVTGSPNDRAAVAVHDIGIRMHKNDADEIGFEILVGGGQGRTPHIGKTIRKWLPENHLLSYLEAILRIYNLYGRRDNIYKARIKILVNHLGIDEFRKQVDQEWENLKEGELKISQKEIDRTNAYFQPPTYEKHNNNDFDLISFRKLNSEFNNWMLSNVAKHKVPGYAIVNLSLKGPDRVPGDLTDHEMDCVADLADHYSFGELRINHRQNLVFTDVKKSDLTTLWKKLKRLGLATANIGQLTDMICCPGLDYCSLANARSIPVAEQITNRFENLKKIHGIGDLTINISGCVNACGHHHVGNIGVLGVKKDGKEYYQFTLGGSSAQDASLGKRTGPGLPANSAVDGIETIVKTYLSIRDKNEPFIETYRRVGMPPFKEALYGTD